MQEFAEIIKHFDEATAEAVSEKITNQENLILFIGRATCPYCRLFAPKLAQVAKDNHLKIAFLDSDNFQDWEAIEDLRRIYQVRTVPGLLVANQGKVRVVCNSQLTQSEILEFIEA